MSISDHDRSDLLAAAEARVFARLREAAHRESFNLSNPHVYWDNVRSILADPPQAEKVAPSFLPRTKGDWPEDFTEENGCYQHRCLRCGDLFFGHKRRCMCKPCFEKPAKPPEQPAVNVGDAIAGWALHWSGCSDYREQLAARINEALADERSRQRSRFEEMVKTADIVHRLTMTRGSLPPVTLNFVDADMLLAALRADASEGK